MNLQEGPRGVKRRFSLLLLPIFLSCVTSVRPSRMPLEDEGPQESKSTSPLVDKEEARIPVADAVKPLSLTTPERSDPETVEVHPKLSPLIQKLEHLESFYSALDKLRAGERQGSVRIMWLGDSHTAADFMTQRVRLHLNAVGGRGGPGFVRLGHSGYRHGAVLVTTSGTVRRAPILPAQRTRVLDGVFGYGGIRTRPQAGSRVSVVLREKSAAPVQWTLSYRLPAGAKLELLLGDKVLEVESGEEGKGPLGAIRSEVIQGTAMDTFSIRHRGGSPEVFGAFCDFEELGVVLDTVGINGARTATPLAWKAQQFIEEVRARAPELLVLAFGTNEVFDRTSVARYEEHTSALIRRVREALPSIPCWVVGPPDSATKSGSSKLRVLQVTEIQASAAREQGCAFTSAFELMGGEGSFARWARMRPAKARSDRVHLTVSGYRELGDLLARTLVSLPEPSKTVESESRATQVPAEAP